MVHLLSYQRRSEFLSGSSIARFEMCLHDSTSHPTLYIKSNIIDLYFVAKSECLTFELLGVGDDMFAYIIGIDEGERDPLHLFSSVETLSEKHALSLIAAEAKLDVILFNDYAIEVARATGSFNGPSTYCDRLRRFAPPGPDYLGDSLERLTKAVSEHIDGKRGHSAARIHLSKFESASTSHVISGKGNLLEVRGFSRATEVHEMLPQIVGDHTFLQFVHSPEVEVSVGNRRELSDALIFGNGGLLSLQAKCFDFEGEIPPTRRSNAEKRMQKNVQKAIKQTKGSARMLREKKKIFSQQDAISIADHRSINFAIFIPSLDLISEELDYELAQLGDHLSAFGENLVVLDPMQFLRTLQAAEQAYGILGCTSDEAFFHLLEQNSQQASNRGSYRTPILYRW